jgi:hypothetical protein
MEIRSEVDTTCGGGYRRPQSFGQIVDSSSMAVLRRDARDQGIFSLVLDREAGRAPVHLKRRGEQSSSTAPVELERNPQDGRRATAEK